jgi:hypothetical protein
MADDMKEICPLCEDEAEPLNDNPLVLSIEGKEGD